MGKSRFSELRQDLEDGRAGVPGGVVVRKRVISIPYETFTVYIFYFLVPTFFWDPVKPAGHRNPSIDHFQKTTLFWRELFACQIWDLVKTDHTIIKYDTFSLQKDWIQPVKSIFSLR